MLAKLCAVLQSQLVGSSCLMEYLGVASLSYDVEAKTYEITLDDKGCILYLCLL